MPKRFKRKSAFAWNKKQTLLTCNNVPVAEVITEEDELFDEAYYSVLYVDKTVKPGKNGWVKKDKAIAHITKRFKLV